MAKVTQAVLGEHLDMDRSQVSDLKRRGIFDPEEGLDACRVRYLRHLKAIASGRQGSNGEHDLTDERARLAHHQANNEELKEQINKGELLKFDEVVKKWAGMIINTKSKLLMIPSRMAPKLLQQKTVKDIERMLKAEIVNALEEMRNE